ncbi:MAG: NTPase [candidate division WOR-3 bacterium]
MPKVLLFGKPKSGKTTLVKKVLAELPKNSYGGFWTEEIKEQEERVGFKVVTTEGEEGILAHKDYRSPYRVSKYYVNVTDFERVALKTLDNAEKSKDLIVIDEIGKMELFSQKFAQVIEKIFANKHKKVLATIPISNIPLIEKLKKLPDATVMEVTPANRDFLATKILKLIK